MKLASMILSLSILLVSNAMAKSTTEMDIDVKPQSSFSIDVDMLSKISHKKTKVIVKLRANDNQFRDLDLNWLALRDSAYRLLIGTRITSNNASLSLSVMGRLFYSIRTDAILLIGENIGAEIKLEHRAKLAKKLYFKTDAEIIYNNTLAVLAKWKLEYAIKRNISRYVGIQVTSQADVNPIIGASFKF